MSGELLSCPFCGSNNIAERGDSICCRQCNAMVNEHTIEDARIAWNTRTPPSGGDNVPTKMTKILPETNHFEF